MLIKDIEFELSNYCNADCPLCARNYLNKDILNSKFRPISELLLQLDNIIKNNSVKWIRLVGAVSEPTLHPKFLKLITELKNRNLNIEICTNGDTRTPDFWKSLNKLLDKNDKVYFTICGSTQEVHELYRKKTNLKNILNNIKYFQSGNTKNKIDYAQCIQFDYNYQDLNSERFKKMISFISNIYMTKTYLKMNSKLYKNYQDIIENKLKPIQNIQYQKINKIVSNFKLSTKKIACKAKEDNSIFIDINGNINPCYLFYEQAKLNNINIKNWSYNKIENFEYEACKFCEICTRKILEKKDMEYII
jgi:organic radical activating enzyme